MQRQRQRLEWYSYKSRNVKDFWETAAARKKRGKIFLKCLQREHCSGLAFWPPKLWKNRFLLFSATSSVKFSGLVMCDSLWPHGLQHTRLPCPSPTPGVYSNTCPPSWWCHPTISSSVVPFSSSLQSFPASGSFPMSQFFPSGGQSIGVSPSASVFPMNIQDWFPLGLIGWIHQVCANLLWQPQESNTWANPVTPSKSSAIL